MIRLLIDLYIGVLIVDTILSYFPQYRFKPWAIKIRTFADYSCIPIRRYLPKDLPFDFSPLVVIVILNILKMLW